MMNFLSQLSLENGLWLFVVTVISLLFCATAIKWLWRRHIGWRLMQAKHKRNSDKNCGWLV